MNYYGAAAPLFDDGSVGNNDEVTGTWEDVSAFLLRRLADLEKGIWDGGERATALDVTLYTE
jgi:hypothetical protein